MAGRFEVQLEQPPPAVRPLEPAAQRPIEIGELGSVFFVSECLIREGRDRVRLLNLREQSPQRQQGPPAVDAAVPIEAAEEDRVELAWREHVLIAGKHMIELVRIFARDVAEGDACDARSKCGIELGHRWNPAMKRMRMLAISNGSAVAT